MENYSNSSLGQHRIITVIVACLIQDRYKKIMTLTFQTCHGYVPASNHIKNILY